MPFVGGLGCVSGSGEHSYWVSAVHMQPCEGKRTVGLLAGLWGLSLVARPRTQWEDGTVQLPLTLLCWNWT